MHGASEAKVQGFNIGLPLLVAHDGFEPVSATVDVSPNQSIPVKQVEHTTVAPIAASSR